MLAQAKNISQTIQRKQGKLAAPGKGKGGTGIWDECRMTFTF